MRQQSYRHRTSGGSRVGGAALLILSVIIGAALVYALILWFRSDTKDKDVNGVLAEVSAAVTTPVVTDVRATASLTFTSGGSAGMAYRQGTPEVPSYNVLVSLPAVTIEGNRYEIWMVKDGIADVKSVGMLDPRADGTWAKSFTLADPLHYPNIIIMLEPNDGNSGPSGNIIAQGRFE